MSDAKVSRALANSVAIAAIADVHVGLHKRHGGNDPAGGILNERCRRVLKTLRDACKLAAVEKVSALVIAGDLFDYVRPEAPIVREVQKVLKAAHDAEIKIFILKGNHEEISTAPGDHALGPLAPYATIVEQPMAVKVTNYELLLVPYRPGKAWGWLPEAVAGIVNDANERGGPGRSTLPARRVLALHLGIRDAATPPWLQKAHDAVDLDKLVGLCGEHGIGRVIAGNWHERKFWSSGGVEVLQIGALCPTGWDNPSPVPDEDATDLGPYGTVALLGNAFDYAEIAGPRFVKARSIEEADRAKRVAHRLDHHLYLSLEVPPEDGKEARAWVANAVEKGDAVGGEVQYDGALAKAEAKNAASAARRADSLEEAVTTFVKAMPFRSGNEHADRDGVREKAIGYLRAARGKA